MDVTCQTRTGLNSSRADDLDVSVVDIRATIRRAYFAAPASFVTLSARRRRRSIDCATIMVATVGYRPVRRDRGVLPERNS